MKSLTPDQYRRFELCVSIAAPSLCHGSDCADMLKHQKLEIQCQIERLKELKEELKEVAAVLRTEQHEAMEGEGGWEDIRKEDMKAPRRGHR